MILRREWNLFYEAERGDIMSRLKIFLTTLIISITSICNIAYAEDNIVLEDNVNCFSDIQLVVPPSFPLDRDIYAGCMIMTFEPHLELQIEQGMTLKDVDYYPFLRYGLDGVPYEVYLECVAKWEK